MNLIFDEEKCTKCMQCKMVCPAGVIGQNETTKKPFELYPAACIECGHCVAVCRYDAIQHENLPMEDFTPVNPVSIEFTDLDGFMKKRRSIRRFKKKIPSKEHIASLLESVSHNPTAENHQAMKYAVITNPDILWNIKSKMAKIFNLGYGATKIPLIKSLIPKGATSSLVSITNRWTDGTTIWSRKTEIHPAKWQTKC